MSVVLMLFPSGKEASCDPSIIAPRNSYSYQGVNVAQGALDCIPSPDDLHWGGARSSFIVSMAWANPMCRIQSQTTMLVCQHIKRCLVAQREHKLFCPGRKFVRRSDKFLGYYGYEHLALGLLWRFLAGSNVLGIQNAHFFFEFEHFILVVCSISCNCECSKPGNNGKLKAQSGVWVVYDGKHIKWFRRKAPSLKSWQLH